MKRLGMIAVLLYLSISTLSAQKKVYNLPKSIDQTSVRLTFQKVSSSTPSYFINYKAENTGSGVLMIDRKLTALEQNEGELFPTSDKYVLKSGENKTIYNQFRVKAPVQANADLLKLKLKGMTYAKFAPAVTGTPKLVLGEGATVKIIPFDIKVTEYNVYSDRVYAQIKCTFKGDIKSVGSIDLTQLVVSGGEADIVKKGDIIPYGKSYTFSINITPNGEELAVIFDGVLSAAKIKPILIDDIEIKSTDYVAPEEVEEKKEEPKIAGPATPIKELTFSDFMALKKDIEAEINNGGQPIAMANEFLTQKGGISTVQVIDILGVFNLDGSRLKFAKMAYPFTSDKGKYHMVVGKMQYVKNKQALEEFLENQ